MAISAAVYEKMPAEIKALVRAESNPGKDAVVALFPDGAPPKAARTGLRGGSPIHGAKGMGSPDKVGHWPADEGGSAARFFNSFPADDIPWPLAFYHSRPARLTAPARSTPP